MFNFCEWKMFRIQSFLKHSILLYCMLTLVLFVYLILQKNKDHKWIFRHSVEHSMTMESLSLTKNVFIRTARNGSNPPIIFVLGGPGSGKGTQCQLIVEEFQFVHISVGGLMRNEAKSGTKRGQQIKYAMEQGQIVPPNWTIELLIKAMESTNNSKGYLIDGFPRNIKHGPLFEKQVGACDLVLVLDCTEVTMTKRILQRANISNRLDDNKTTLNKRLMVYKKETLPVIQYYESLGKVVKVNSERFIHEVYTDIREILVKHLMNELP